jgi:molybdenum cofactor guanylyltransferase
VSVVGVVLAGGRGERIGGDKAMVELDGRPLLAYPLRALQGVTARRAVVAKAATALPPLPAAVERWDEPDLPGHPLTGVLHALRRAAGAAVLSVPVDTPRLDAATLRVLLAASGDGRRAAVAEAGGRLQPLCAVWPADTLLALDALPEGVAMRDVVEAVGALVVPFADARTFANVNAPEDVARLSRT